MIDTDNGFHLGFCKGNFDDYCVQVSKKGYNYRWFKDEEYFRWLKRLSERYGVEKVYDDFKYVRPVQTRKESEIRVLNNSRGMDKFCCVIYNGNNSIVVENYDANDTVEISSYFLTDDARSFISSGSVENGMNGFLFQVSGGNMGYIEKLQFGSKIIVKKEGENLVSYGSDNSIIGMAPINEGGAPGDISFYRAVERNVDYYGLLDNQYSSSNEYSNKSSVNS